jgi:hypothetical protein
MAGGEDEPQAIVRERIDLALVVVDRPQRRQRRELRALGLQSALAPQPVDRPVAGDAGDPGTGVVGDSIARPALDRDRERLLDRLLGCVEVAQNADQGRNRPSGLLPEGAVDDPGVRYEETSATRPERSNPNCV